MDYTFLDQYESFCGNEAHNAQSPVPEIERRRHRARMQRAKAYLDLEMFASSTSQTAEPVDVA